MKKIEFDELFNKISSDYGSKLERVRRKLIIKSMLLFLIVFFVSLYMVYNFLETHLLIQIQASHLLLLHELDLKYLKK